MAARTVDPTGQRDNLILTAAAVVLAGVAVGGAWVSLHVAAYLGQTRIPTRDPLRLVVELVTGRQAWSLTATKVAAVLAVVVLVLVVGAVLLWPHSKRMRPDRSARHMGSGRDLAHLTATGSAAKAKRLGSAGTGLPIGQTVHGGRMLFSSWEDMAILQLGGHGDPHRRPQDAEDRLRGPCRPGSLRRLPGHQQQTGPPRRHPRSTQNLG